MIALFRRLFHRPNLDGIKCSIAGHSISPSRKPQYYSVCYTEDASQLQPTSAESWSLCVEFTAPSDVIITIHGTLALFHKEAVCLDVDGSLTLRQAAPSAGLILSGSTCGLRTTGSVSSELDTLSISASAGPALEVGGSFQADGFKTVSLSGSQPLYAAGDIYMKARQTPDATIEVVGGICAQNGNVQLICPKAS